MNIIRGFVSILGSKIGKLILGVVITPLIVRFLGSELYGDYAFLMSLLAITMIIVNAGIFDGTRKFIAEDMKNSNWVEQVFGFYLRVAIILALIVAVAFAVFSWIGLAERFLGDGFEVYFYLLGLLIVARQANSVARGGLMGLGLEDRSEPLLVIRKLLFGVSAVSLLYLGYNVGGVLVGHFLATSVTAAVAYVFFFKRVDVKSVFIPVTDGFPKRELLSFNGLSIVLILLTASLYHVDILFLRLIAGDQATGYYRAALVIAEFLWFVPTALQMVLLHSSSELWSKGENTRITELSSRATRYNLSFILLLAIGLTALASDFLPLYFGPEFEASVLPLLVLLPGVIGFALARPMFAIGQGKGDLSILIGATGTAALVNLLLNVLLIPMYGMIGAAVATSIGYGLMAVLHTLAARRNGFNPVQNLRLVRIGIVAVIAAIFIFGAATLIESSIISLIVVPPLGFIVYSVLTFRFEVISIEELEPVTNRLPETLEKHIEPVLQWIT
ncbi:oligosaccharide flippase family protein [Natranaeroarchaeum sulfidigenes]|uniref:MATE family membrane protein, Rfbx family n=1 Tax=Natranaeroarchaeum sulfidigenes TaxID=2784880 RepID=A0A897MMV1_9EURY|nr:oligosaccharide flippase family protein [Natranaeroarchaeum sulfidigenes]QSG01701.1 MATE family membrane protein, Rfbx family [Natranaeroarchaeum sulfidigenes]